MTQSYRNFVPTLAATLAFAMLASTGAAQAQAQASDPSTDSNVPSATAQKQAREIARGDPSRWFIEDASMAARLASVRKEIGASLQEAQGACRKLAAAERAGCVKQARATYQQDMAGARGQVMANSRP